MKLILWKCLFVAGVPASILSAFLRYGADRVAAGVTALSLIAAAINVVFNSRALTSNESVFLFGLRRLLAVNLYAQSLTIGLWAFVVYSVWSHWDLQREADVVRITGFVTYGSAREPAENAIVILTTSKGQIGRAVTTHAGEFSVGPIARTKLVNARLETRFQNLQLTQKIAKQAPEAPHYLEFAEEFIRIGATLLDEARLPIIGAVVMATRPNGSTISATTTTNGEFKLPAFYGIRQPVRLEIKAKGAKTWHEVLPDKFGEDHVIHTDLKCYQVRGIVLEQTTGEPLEGVHIEAVLPGTQERAVAITSPSGRFEFPFVYTRVGQGGRVLITATHGNKTTQQNLGLAAAAPMPVRMELKLKPSPLRRTFYTLKGHAVDRFVSQGLFGPGSLAEARMPYIIANNVMKTVRELYYLFGTEFKSPRMSISVLEQGEELRNASEVLPSTPDTPMRTVAATLGNESDRQGVELGLSLELFGALKSSFSLTRQWRIKPLPLSVGPDGFAEFLASSNAEETLDASQVIALKEGTGDDLVTLWNFARRDPTFVFYKYILRKNIPDGFFFMQPVHACSSPDELNLRLMFPALQLRVLVLENISAQPVECGEFGIKEENPTVGALVRTGMEIDLARAATATIRKRLFGPAVLKPGERLVLPLEIVMIHSTREEEFEGADLDGFAKRVETVGTSLAEGETPKNVQLVIGEGSDAEDEEEGILPPPGNEPVGQAAKTGAGAMRARKVEPLSLVRMSRKELLGALQAEIPDSFMHYEPRRQDEFIYAGTMAVETIEVNGHDLPITQFDPVLTLYTSSSEEGAGSCPYIYSVDPRRNLWEKERSILTGQNSPGKERSHIIHLRNLGALFRLVEEEDEISYVDSVRLHVRRADGREETFETNIPLLKAVDRHYLVLKKGNETLLHFNYIPEFGDSLSMEATGYFVPTGPRTQER